MARNPVLAARAITEVVTSDAYQYTGPCVRCQTPCIRYGPYGSPLCSECRTTQEKGESEMTAATTGNAALDKRAQALAEQTPDKIAAERVLHIQRAIRAATDELETFQKLISEAYAERDWEALGYPDWGSYVKGKLARELNKSEKRLMEAGLAALGMSTRAIALAVGTSQTTVVRDLKEEQVNRNGSPETPAEPATVTGTDGKHYPKPPKPAPEPPAPKLPLLGEALRFRGLQGLRSTGWNDLDIRVDVGKSVSPADWRFEFLPGTLPGVPVFTAMLRRQAATLTELADALDRAAGDSGEAAA